MQNRTTNYVEAHHKTKSNSAQRSIQKPEQTARNKQKSASSPQEIFSALILALFQPNCEKQKSPVNTDPYLRGINMPTYILLSTLTDEGRRTVKERPERIQEVNKEIEALGAKVMSQYVVLGPYDFVNVVEAPDNKTIAQAAMELGSRGTVQIMSLAAIPVNEFIASMKKTTAKKK
jgi:uncharacterized protein with GYD domain